MNIGKARRWDGTRWYTRWEGKDGIKQPLRWLVSSTSRWIFPPCSSQHHYALLGTSNSTLWTSRGVMSWKIPTSERNHQWTVDSTCLHPIARISCLDLSEFKASGRRPRQPSAPWKSSAPTEGCCSLDARFISLAIGKMLPKVLYLTLRPYGGTPEVPSR